MRVSFNFLVCHAYHHRRTISLWQTTCAMIIRDYPQWSVALLGGFDAFDEVPVIRASASDDYHSCHDKTYAVLDRHQSSNADWFVIADDDTWFNLRNLAALLPLLPSDFPVICGNISQAHKLPILHAHGGSGILINSLAFASLASVAVRPRHSLHSDISLAMCAAAAPVEIQWAQVDTMHGPDEPLSAIKPMESVSIHVKDRISFADLQAAASCW